MSDHSPVRRQVDWALRLLREGRVPDDESLRAHFEPAFLEAASPESLVAGFKQVVALLSPIEVTRIDESSPYAATVTYSGRRGAKAIMECRVDESGLITFMSNNRAPDLDDLELTTQPAAEVSDAHRADLHALFAVCYRRPNHRYLDESLDLLDHVAMARLGGDLVGFAIAQTRFMHLPELTDACVIMGGLCCIAPDARRKGLMSWLENAAALRGLTRQAQRHLGCGRMAHPASVRPYRVVPWLVPRYGVVPTPWQQQVGAVVADAYGVEDFDPVTFVCRGRGAPIGYPVLDIDARPDEWDVFKDVDRDRGDSLLAICWQPTPPPGW